MTTPRSRVHEAFDRSLITTIYKIQMRRSRNLTTDVQKRWLEDLETTCRVTANKAREMITMWDDYGPMTEQQVAEIRASRRKK